MYTYESVHCVHVRWSYFQLGKNRSIQRALVPVVEAIRSSSPEDMTSRLSSRRDPWQDKDRGPV